MGDTGESKLNKRTERMKKIQVDSCINCPLKETVVVGRTGKGTQSNTTFTRCKITQKTIDIEIRDSTIHFDCTLLEDTDVGTAYKKITKLIGKKTDSDKWIYIIGIVTILCLTLLTITA